MILLGTSIFVVLLWASVVVAIWPVLRSIVGGRASWPAALILTYAVLGCGWVHLHRSLDSKLQRPEIDCRFDTAFCGTSPDETITLLFDVIGVVAVLASVLMLIRTRRWRKAPAEQA